MNRFRIHITSLLIAGTVCPSAGVLAQTPAVPQLAQPGAAAPVPGGDRLTPSELEELVGPIALYPDPLLANVLAASVYPDEVAEAAKFIAGGGKSEQVDAKPWEAPVKAVAKIPDAIKIMGQYGEWTVALGQAYLLQAKDVMDVIQSLRKKAQSNGALQTSPQQKVVVEQEVVYIKPADPEVIYVPSYSPSVVYVEDDDDDVLVAGVVGFGLGVATGLILANNMDCHWGGGYVGYGGWHGGGYNGGNNDINIDRSRTINGDVNIGNNVGSGNRASAGNRVGNEGNAWSPNRAKPLANSRPSQLNQFKGGAGGAGAANRAALPGGGRAGTPINANRPNGGAGQGGARAGQQPGGRSGAAGGAGNGFGASGGAGAGAGARGGAGAGSGARGGAGGGVGAGSGARSGAGGDARPGAGSGAGSGARSGAQPAQRPAAQPARPNAGAGAGAGAGAARPSATPRVPPTPPRQSSPSAFSGGRDTQAASDRGAASRAQSPSRSSGAGSSARSAPSRPSGGGGAARSAPSRSSGGGRRR